MTHILQILTKK